MLVLRIDFLNGVFHASDPCEPHMSEWPPHPDRLYQALVAAAYECELDPTPVRVLEGLAPDILYGEAKEAQHEMLSVPAAYKGKK